MKKFLLLSAAALLCAQFASAEYKSMLVRTVSGQSYTIGLDDIRIAIADGKLELSNSNESVALPLDELTSMEFSDLYCSVAEITAIEGEVEIFSVSGRSLGKFDKASDAVTNLPAGIYVIKSSTGITRKFSVAK